MIQMEVGGHGHGDGMLWTRYCGNVHVTSGSDEARGREDVNRCTEAACLPEL